MFQIQCDNRKCMKLQESRLDIQTNQVICQECGESINNVTEFAKRQLKSLGQTNKQQKSRQSYATKCDACKATAQPVLINDTVCCQFCKVEFNNMTPIFKSLVYQALTKAVGDDQV